MDDTTKAPVADDTRGPQERLYDEVIRPALSAVLDLCHEHHIPMFAAFHLDCGTPDGATDAFCGTRAPLCGAMQFARAVLCDDNIVGAIGLVRDGKTVKPGGPSYIKAGLPMPPMPPPTGGGVMH